MGDFEFDLSVPRELKNLRLVGDLVFSFCEFLRENFHLDDLFSHNMKLVVSEAFANSVKYTKAPAGCEDVICVRAILSEPWFRLEIFDYGEGFDLENIRDAEENLDGESGRGLYIIRTLVDEVAVEKRDERNCFVMRKKLA